MYIYDIESFPNLFVIVFKDYNTGKLFIFQLSDYKNDIKALKEFCKSKSKLILLGYNNNGYDDQLLYYILTCKIELTALNIKDKSDQIINSKRSIYPPWEIEKIIHTSLDIMNILNMGITSAKTTSLKMWEFNLRDLNIQDLPFAHYKNVTTSSNIDLVIKYCINDVNRTEYIIKLNKDQLEIRKSFSAISGINHINDSETQLVKKYTNKIFSQKLNIDEKDFKNLKTYRDSIIIKNILVNKESDFKLQKHKNLFNYYNNQILKPTLKSKLASDKKIFSLKELNHTIEYDNSLVTIYGSGGIHGCVNPGIYSADDEYTLEDFDFSSFYPNLIAKYNLEPDHLGKDVLGSQLMQWYNDRMTLYPKKTHFNLNYAIKIILNLSYGLLGSEYSSFFDQQAQLAVCINGMMFITELTEICMLNDAEVLYQNTDGILIKTKISNRDKIIKLVQEYSEKVQIEIENVSVKKLIINNVNNFILVDQYDNIKEKGLFETYDTIVKNKMFWKDTSKGIIAKALVEYFVNNIPIETTINNENNILEFAICVKGSKNYILQESEEGGKTLIAQSEVDYYDEETQEEVYKYRLVEQSLNKNMISNKYHDQRILRYFIATEGSTLFKNWYSDSNKGFGFDSVEATAPVVLINSIRKSDIFDFDKNGNKKLNKNGEIVNRFPQLDRQWYIDKCMTVVNKIENNNQIIN